MNGTKIEAFASSQNNFRLFLKFVHFAEIRYGQGFQTNEQK